MYFHHFFKQISAFTGIWDAKSDTILPPSPAPPPRLPHHASVGGMQELSSQTRD